ncbi:Glyoxalase/bleomycin resistance protein/dioxygenase [Catenulispora acidiphila DSM 44928]|uniref:Glyoxalase/bleomycin resistance protein/dioxygenase n=1 Tax=Catenulispora acidiphila (strain DSM 44928 / JCM 14897 / NBRC 102108 / NRRL B-24433 / ID139908) TaxID=479433 RepID=C7PZU4_CATAD|nr:VOC family protein [Catenulispora acidiphila]ACU73609.1 Glyoxalase/bleomycin resistance protein/dioxygenase [Catenulispora acidiphila DSM 44928]
MDHVSINVEDLDAAKRFFFALGMEFAGEAKVGGPMVGRVIGLQDPMSDVVFVRTPDGHSQIELVKHLAAPDPEGPAAPASNRLGLIHVAFQVEDLRDLLAELHALGYDPLGTVENYEDVYLLCFLRGPEGIIVELAEDISAKQAA